MLARMDVSKLDDLPSWAIELVESSRVARLGISDEEGRPRVLPVTFAVAEGWLWTAIDAKPKRDPAREPARVRYLRRDPRAVLTVDRYSDDWDELAWVQVLGDVSIVEAEDARRGLESLIDKYEPYRASPPPGPLLALEPARCLYWSAVSGAGAGT
jgi:PPOX class probable F420-dependent enzyme